MAGVYFLPKSYAKNLEILALPSNRSYNKLPNFEVDFPTSGGL